MILEGRQSNEIIKSPCFGITPNNALYPNLEKVPNIWKTKFQWYRQFSYK